MNAARGRRRGNGSALAVAALNRYKREQHGHVNNLRALDPSMTNKRPFNTLKVHIYKESDESSSSFTITVADVVKAMLTQLGMAVQTGSLAVVKLQRMDVFAADSTSGSGQYIRPTVSVQLSSIVPQLGDPATAGNAIVHYPVLKDMSDVGSRSKPARVSYTYPLSMRDTPLNMNSNFTLGSVFSNTRDVDVFVHVQWSTTDVATAVAP